MSRSTTLSATSRKRGDKSTFQRTDDDEEAFVSYGFGQRCEVRVTAQQERYVICSSTGERKGVNGELHIDRLLTATSSPCQPPPSEMNIWKPLVTG